MVGYGSQMQVTLKNNKRSRPSAFKKLEKIPKGKYKSKITDKKSSPHLLKQIRDRIQEDNRRRLTKNLIIIGISIFIIIYVIGFVKF